MNPYAATFEARVPVAPRTVPDESGYDGDSVGLNSDEGQKPWDEDAALSREDGGGGSAYWNAHGQHHHHASFETAGYGEYDAGTYHPDGYNNAYHQHEARTVHL